METARRLGAFSLVVAFILYILFDQSEPLNLAWRDQLLVYSILFGLLGLLLIVRYRPRGRKSSRFSGFKNFLFKTSKKDRAKATKKRGSQEPIGRESKE